MDFYKIVVKENDSNNRKSDFVISPDFVYLGVKELVAKGRAFYAVWNNGLWSRSLEELIANVDNDLRRETEKLQAVYPDKKIFTRYMNSNSSGVRAEFEQYVKLAPQSTTEFNQKILFSEDIPKLEDYATSQLTYTPIKGATPLFDELMEKLYEQPELDKILWFMGALLTNNMSKIQKFLYLYGGKGTGKGTAIKIFKMIFDGYYAEIDLELLTGGSEFATSQVQEIPLLIDDDSNLSRIRKDTNLLKLTAHEPLLVNQKYHSAYPTTFKGLLITASNQRYQVRNIDSGITRRAVVARPTNETHKSKDYHRLIEGLPFELPHIAQKAIDFFNAVGSYYYEDYVDVNMAEDTDHIYSFVRENADQLRPGISLKRVAEIYKVYLQEIGFDTNGYKRKIKIELQRYFMEFVPQKKVDGEVYKNWFDGFKEELVFPEKAGPVIEVGYDPSYEIEMKVQKSKFDKIARKYPAQYANDFGVPNKKWDETGTILDELDTSKLHYVLVPLNHIVIDLDLKDEEGNKNRERNLEAAAKFPPTYTEYSKSGEGVHLHYIYDGDVSRLASQVEKDIEIKVFVGHSAVRRRLTECNNKDIMHISTGLPLKKEEPNVYGDMAELILTEKKMRTMVINNFKKKYHDATKPSMDYIYAIFEKAQADGVKYDLSDLRADVFKFASRSTNNAQYCIKLANKIVYSTIEAEDEREYIRDSQIVPDEDIVFYDVEVFPNLFAIGYKRKGDKEKTILFNPTPQEVEHILGMPLIGFYNRDYDNHIMYGALLGSTNQELFQQSAKLTSNNKKSSMDGKYSSAFELSYADIYEYASKKQGLKKWEIEMGIVHDEFEEPWNKPLDKSKWSRLGEYLGHDVDATEATFEYTYSDYVARVIIATISGLSVNAKTQEHAARILFGDELNPQQYFNVPDLSEEFPGYTHSFGESEYKGKDPGEGGYVYSQPGVYKEVGLFDVASMHPTTAIEVEYFGPYTQQLADLKQARIYIKHGEFEPVRQMFDGKLAPYLEDESRAKELSYALKIVINIIYGMTSAPYPNIFKSPDNKDNVIAKRGALFMIDLQEACEAKGWTVVHIKTDSIKLANATQEMWEFVYKFGQKYGYEFEWEHTYKKMALVNKSEYIAQLEDDTWEPTGTKFLFPYTLKTLFTHEPIEDADYAITKNAKSPIYVGETFVGKTALVYPSLSGEPMTRRAPDKNPAAVVGTKGYLWKMFSHYEGHKDIDMSYFHKQVQDTLNEIMKVGPIFELLEEKDIPDQYQAELLPF